MVIYPTTHEGGELVLRHKDRELNFDASSTTSSRSSPALACVAFCSDIEHEILKITSGRMVTVAYDLYLVDPVSDPGAPDLQAISNFQTTLWGLAGFLPDGGTRGFGLAHLNPSLSKRSSGIWQMTSKAQTRTYTEPVGSAISSRR